MGVSQDESNVTLCAVGDVSLCDGVEERINKNGVEFPFSKVQYVLKGNDISFANLENVFSVRDGSIKGQAHMLKSNPQNIQAVLKAGFNVISLANNHILDGGKDGLQETISLLDSYEIQHVGAGETLGVARHPVILERKGVYFGFLAYAMKGVQSAGENAAGAAWIDEKQITEDICHLRPKVDHVIVSLHAGLEFINYPHPNHRNLCLKIAESGARLVIGHHPHVIHGIEKVNNCLIAYSLGNLIFDPTLMDYKTERSQQAVVLKCTFNNKRLVSYDVIPVVINSNFQPEIADHQTGEIIIQRLTEISASLSTGDYPGVFFKQASELWPKINIGVNLKIIKEQGLLAFMRRLPRIKKIYLILLFKFLYNQASGLLFGRSR